MNRYNILFLILGLIFSTSLAAQEMNQSTFKDQYNQQQHLDNGTRFLIFTSSKEASKLASSAFESLSLNNTKMKTFGILYVADIHKMPGMITRWVALPKMKEYNFPVALDRKGKLTSGWERKDNAVTIFKLSHLQIIRTSHYGDIENLKTALQEIIDE